jgi:hypothetical protein
MNLPSCKFGAQVAHLGKIFFDPLPLPFPVIFDQPTGVVVVVIEAPGDERLAGLGDDERLLIVGNADARQLGRSEVI